MTTLKLTIAPTPLPRNAHQGASYCMPHITPRHYIKPAKSSSDLIAHLLSRGLIIADIPKATRVIETIGYYRLLIYMRALQNSAKQFLGGACFDDVLMYYNFDRELRLVFLDAIERIEVALRAAIIDGVAVTHGAHFYLEPIHFERIDSYRNFYSRAAQARYLAIEHYQRTYNVPPVAPIWAVSEALTFGELSHLFSGLTLSHRKNIARTFRLDESVLVSWFKTVNDLRNRCAHHNRLWDARLLVNQPMRARIVSAELTARAQASTYGRAVVVATLVQNLDPNENWRQKLKTLIAAHPLISLQRMGFPLDWSTRSTWI